MAAVVPGGLDLVGAEHDLLETAAHQGRVSLQPRKPRHPRAGLGLEEEARKQGQGEGRRGEFARNVSGEAMPDRSLKMSLAKLCE